ncbi:glb-20 [Pristionchus pacificus]|uniref:Glb-20 n=1 Tax=Pristionchus pacificus TaxID=54126 RepID=A0A2A6C524_PRIPA|nr:glb-20 [Pristionchus pacificus]|eukprot:PDM73275.1 glb-20 [Pristionchus pacificus]
MVEKRKNKKNTKKIGEKKCCSEQLTVPSIMQRRNTVTRQKSIRRDIQHPITANGREIIVQCFENPHSEFGNKTCQRIFEKRPDFQNYVFALGKERAFQMTVKLKELVEEVVVRIDDVETIASMCRNYGEEHVELKSAGFKPDFWVALADAITVEGVILDMANHQPADTVAAWAHRMNSRRSNGMKRQTTNESTSSGDQCVSPTTLMPDRPSPLIPGSMRMSTSLYAMENSMPKPTPIFE